MYKWSVRKCGTSLLSPYLAAGVISPRQCLAAAIAFGGAVGAGESYIHGCWSCEELTTLVRILVRSRDVLLEMDSGTARLNAETHSTTADIF